MEPIEVFQILGIEQTKDERALKNAYRDKLTVTNPEDDPEGFKRLRMAYEEACRYAGTRMQKRTRRRNRRWRTILRLDSGYVVFGRSMRILRTAVMWKNGKRFLRRMTFFLWRKRKTAPLICFVF